MCGSLTSVNSPFVDLSEQTPKWQIQEFNGSPYIISFSCVLSNLKFASPAILYFVIFRDMLEAITYGPVSLSTPQSTW
jgi:hypothetical protein